MRWIDIVRISVRMLKTNGLRSMLTVLGIGVAISLIVLLIGLGSGLQNITIGSIVESKTLLSMDIVPPPQGTAPFTLDSVEQVKKINGIKDASPVIVTTGELRLEEKLASVAIEAANPSYLEMQGVPVKNGEGYKEGEAAILVSPAVLGLLDLNEDAVLGSVAKLTYTNPNNESESKTIEKVSVVGISDTTTATIFVPFSLLSDNGSAKMTSIKAVATDRESLVTARDALVSQGYLVETLLDTLDQARSVFRWVTIGLTIFGTIALVVAAIGMFNTLTISLLERTREIGIMKAVGVDDATVKKLFLSEAGLIGFMGGITGITIGLIIATIIGAVFNQISLNLGGIKLDIFQYPAGFLPSMVAYPMLLAVVTGLYPAVRAAKINPLKALRYE